ncbi:MAG TPA: MerR family transcriptional regulator, partial [Thermomicrobiales bacterium]|nr:MerR family transcriptional regulator [Thermomicrobiales bacterium]
MNLKKCGCRNAGITGTTDEEEGEMISGDALDQGPENRERMTLSELTKAADVSVRTVRYYIAEGLLPPPEGSGPGSAYTQGHLDRLRLIQRLKEAYLPLKEIRRRLSGFGDDDVRTLLTGGEERVSADLLSEPESSYDASLAGARDYLALMESGEGYRTEPMSLQFPPSSGPVAAAPSEPVPNPTPVRNRAQRAPVAAPIGAQADYKEGTPSNLPSLWHRIPLGDEAELVISDRVYSRHHDRIDWLVRW